MVCPEIRPHGHHWATPPWWEHAPVVCSAWLWLPSRQMAVTLPSELLGRGTQSPLLVRYMPAGQSSYGGSAIELGETMGETTPVAEAISPAMLARATAVSSNRNMLAPTNSFARALQKTCRRKANVFWPRIRGKKCKIDAAINERPARPGSAGKPCVECTEAEARWGITRPSRLLLNTRRDRQRAYTA